MTRDVQTHVGVCNYVLRKKWIFDRWRNGCSLYSYITDVHDRLFQALYRFSVLQPMESWLGPGNEAKGFQCIVAVRWTGQLPLGLPYAISLQYQKQTSHNHCLSVVKQQLVFAVIYIAILLWWRSHLWSRVNTTLQLNSLGSIELHGHILSLSYWGFQPHLHDCSINSI